MMVVENPISLENPVMRDLVFYSVVILSKMMAMSMVTTRKRLEKRVFLNSEDLIIRPGGRVSFVDDEVERTKRIHLNDLENIVPFVLISILYTLTSPAPTTACWVFRIFAASRIMHSVAYQLALPQPSRALCFFVGYFTTVYMGVKCLIYSM